MDTIGYQSFANRIRSATVKPTNDIQNELRDNSVDADANTIINAIVNNINDGKTRYYHIDDGSGMEPFKEIQPSESAMKPQGKVGMFYNGFVDSLLSMNADTTYVFSKKEDSELKLWFYKVRKMKNTTQNSFNIGERGCDITHRYRCGNNDEKCIYGPYMLCGEEDPISSRHWEDTFGPLDSLTNEPLIKSFMNGTLTHGTAIITVYNKNSAAILNEKALTNYFKALPYMRKPYSKDIQSKYFISSSNSWTEYNSSDAVSFFGGRDNIISVIDCVADLDNNDAYVKFNNKYFRLGSSVRICGSEISFRSRKQIAQGPNSVTFKIRSSFVGSNIREQQLQDLNIDDFKQLNMPAIETDYGFLGIGNYKIPSKFTGRSKLGYLEGLNSRQTIYIPLQYQSQLFPVFGINGKKDRPENEEPTILANNIYELIARIAQLYVGKLYKTFNPSDEKNVYGKDANKTDFDFPYYKILEYGFTEETKVYFSKEDDIEWVLENAYRNTLKKPIKTSYLYYKWLIDFKVNEYNTFVSEQSSQSEYETEIVREPINENNNELVIDEASVSSTSNTIPDVQTNDVDHREYTEQPTNDKNQQENTDKDIIEDDVKIDVSEQTTVTSVDDDEEPAKPIFKAVSSYVQNNTTKQDAIKYINEIASDPIKYHDIQHKLSGIAAYIFGLGGKEDFEQFITFMPTQCIIDGIKDYWSKYEDHEIVRGGSQLFQYYKSN